MQIVNNQILICGGISNVEDNNLNFCSISLLDDFWSFYLDKKIFKQWPNLRLPNPRAAFGLIRLDKELLLIAGLEIDNCDQFNVKFNLNLLSNLRNNDDALKYGEEAKKLEKTVVITSTVLECKLDQSIELSECKWSIHSKLNQQRVFPSVSRCSDSVLVMGGCTQNHLFLKKVSITNFCSTYEILNCQTSRWFVSPMMFATFGASLIELRNCESHIRSR